MQGEKGRKNLIGGQSFDSAEHVISMTSLHANCAKAKKNLVIDIARKSRYFDCYLKN